MGATESVGNPGHGHNAVKRTKDQHVIKILCYGDSNTAGFHNGGKSFEPYAKTLKKELSTLGVTCETAVCGLSGLTAQEMAEKTDHSRIEDVCQIAGKGILKMIEEFGTPDLAIIMAGTNDLGRGRDPEDVLESVKVLHDACHERKIKTFAMVGPQGMQGPSRTVRRIFARLLKEWAEHSSGVLEYVDSEELVPRSAGRSELWEKDGLHFAPKGSQQLGRLLAEKVEKCFSERSMSAARFDSLDSADSMAGRDATCKVLSPGTVTGPPAPRFDSVDSMVGRDATCQLNLPWPFAGQTPASEKLKARLDSVDTTASVESTGSTQSAGLFGSFFTK